MILGKEGSFARFTVEFARSWMFGGSRFLLVKPSLETVHRESFEFPSQIPSQYKFISTFIFYSMIAQIFPPSSPRFCKIRQGSVKNLKNCFLKNCHNIIFKLTNLKFNFYEQTLFIRVILFIIIDISVDF